MQQKSDFLWLTPAEAKKYKYVYVRHQERYSDKPCADKDPLSTNKYHSIDSNGKLSIEIKRYRLEFIDQWKRKCENTNVFRSLNLFTGEQDGEELVGPLVLDIDRERGDWGKGYTQNLDDALEAARKLVKEYLFRLKDDDFRIFFTGHKGFNIEVRPQALGIASNRNREQGFDHRLKEINKIFGNSFVDGYHDFLRLHDSINSWVSINGKITHRMKFELTSDELNSMSIEEICLISEKLARNFLNKS